MYLYRKWRLAVTLRLGLAWALAWMVAWTPGLQAQVFRAPQPERTTPRAVGVLETYGDGTRRLIPVSFFYEHRYYDASFYRATPVPFTLSSETVYEVQQFGKALGSFTVRSASRSGETWFGNGHYKPAPDDASPAAMKKKAIVAPAVVLDDPSRPVLHRRAGSEGDHPAAHAAGQSDATSSAGNDDPDRPVLHRHEESDTARAGAGRSGTDPQGTDHPVLRRGKPVEEQSGGDLPEFDAKAQPHTRGAEAVSRQVAVSDAGQSEPQDLSFACPPEKREQMEAQARELARFELREVAAKRGLALGEAEPIEGKTASAKSGTHPSLARRNRADRKPQAVPALVAEEEQFAPYDLDYSDYATVVYSARYRPEAATGGSAANDTAPAGGAGSGNASLPAGGALADNASLPAAGVTAGNAALSAVGASAGALAWVVTVIARQDGDKLVKLYSAVSDPRELDLYPEVRLVDAVDPDGYGRYGLLFREQKRDGVSWLLGRVSGYEMQTLFETAER